MIQISASDLIYLNEVVKSLKQRDFIYTNGIIIGLDLIDSCLCYAPLDGKMITIDSLPGILMNAKDLSAFVKTITVESSFIEDIAGNFTTMAGGMLHLNYSPIYMEAKRRFSFIISFIDCKPNLQIDMPKIADKLKGMHMADGSIHEIINNEYYITLFPGLIPLNKADTLSANFYNNSHNSFITEYIVRKKNITIHILISYLKI